MPVEPSHSHEFHESVSELVRPRPAILTDYLKAARRGEGGVILEEEGCLHYYCTEEQHPTTSTAQ